MVSILRPFLFLLLLPLVATAEYSVDKTQEISRQQVLRQASDELTAYVWFARGERFFLIEKIRFSAESRQPTPDLDRKIKAIAQLFQGERARGTVDSIRVFGTGFRVSGREWGVAQGQRIAEIVKSALERSGVPQIEVEAVSSGREYLQGFEPTLALTAYPEVNEASVEGAPTGPMETADEKAALLAEVAAGRKRQQELEEQLAKERERIASVQASQSVGSAAPIRSAHALVIGNAAYPGSARLDNPVNDANAIGQKLRSMGFNVTTISDSNRQQMLQALARFRRTAGNADVSVFFYSGHGVQIDGVNYVLPIDIDQSDVEQATLQGMSLNLIIDNFLPGKSKLVFLDACRDNPLQRNGSKNLSKGLAPISAAQGTLIAYATKDGQTASDGSGQRNSPFTQALVQHLADPLDISVILRRVREKVMTATGGKQQPWDYGNLTGGELILVKATR
jgi:Caspase domain